MFSRSKEGGWSSDTKCGGKRSGGFIDVNGGVSKGGSLIVTHHEYPSNGYQGGNSGSYGGINTHGGSYSSPEQHIQQVCAFLGGNVLGGAYHDGRKNRDVFGDGINYQVKGIISETKYYGFKNPKGIVLSDCALEDRDIAVLTNHLKCHRLDLVVFDVSNNKIGIVGVKYLFGGLRFDNPSAERCIVTMNFSNNLIGDDGAKYMADCLKMGRYPHLKSLDVSGNQITATGVGYFLDALKNSTVGNIIIKQYHLSIFGNKENKIGFMKDYLKQAQDKGVDVNNIVVDKSLYGYIKNTGKICKDTVVGFAKCYYVDDVVTDHIKDKILAKVSKTLGVLNNYNDVINCYAETFDGVMSSTEGVQLIKTDLEVMGESSVINAIE